MFKIALPAKMASVGNALDFIEESLQSRGFSKKNIREAMMISEEAMIKLLPIAPEGSEMHLKVKFKAGLADIKISVPGDQVVDSITPFDFSEEESAYLDQGSEATVRSILLSSYSNCIKSSRKGKYNVAVITAGNKEKISAIFSITALVSAIVVGLILQWLLPETAQNVLNTYLLEPVIVLFMRSLKLMVAPLIFFSIITSVAKYSSFSDPGRVSIKIFLGYAITSVIAVFIGYAAFAVFQPGIFGTISDFAVSKNTFEADTSTVLATITKIVPETIVEPFLTMDSLQIIFLSLVFGIAIGRVGDYSQPIRRASDAMETLCGKVSELLNSCVPVVVFFATISLVLNIGIASLAQVAKMALTLLAALLAIMLMYFIMLCIFGINPITFIKKYYKTMGSTFMAGSGLAALPKTIRCCKNSLGISPKIYTFSIPFGAMANMDGTCIYLTIAGLFLAKMSGIDIPLSDAIPLIATVLILSVGAPMAAGTVLICATVLLEQLGVSVTALSLILGINVVVEMLLGMSDTFGDVAMTLAVAKSEKLLDEDAFNAKPRKRKKTVDFGKNK